MKPPAVRAALARIATARGGGAGGAPARCVYRRLHNEISRRWLPEMWAALRRLDVGHHGGDVVAVFGVAGATLVATFPARYPFLAPVLRVEERAVRHGAEVARALRARLPLPLVAAVRRHLRAPRRVPLKEWAYHRLRRRHGPSSDEANECVAACTRDLPPHHWSPCLGLEHQWGAVARLLRRCHSDAPHAGHATR